MNAGAALLSPPAPGGFIADELHRAGAGGAALAIVTVTAPGIGPVAAELASAADLVWRSPGGATLLGWGEAVSISGNGERRFAQVREAANWWFRRARTAVQPGASYALPPRFFGGFSFAPGNTGSEWSEFGDAHFSIPELLWGCSSEGEWLTVAVASPARAEHRQRALARVERWLKHAGRRRHTMPEPASPAHIVETDPREWLRLVESALATIRAGEVEKVVAARRTEVQWNDSSPQSPGPCLWQRYPDCYQFQLSRGEARFIGASPERLVSRSGEWVKSEALAGTQRGDATSCSLLESDKDRREQATVVRMIREALAPLCSSLDADREPQIRKLRHLCHLVTPIEGRLRSPRHVLDLVARLHPTPAVGGYPRARALDWVAREESFDRGWYAAPVGWFNSSGDGEFAVAIRSALFTPNRCLLYSGAGIVDGSDPASEYRETSLKQRAVLDSLTSAEVAAA